MELKEVDEVIILFDSFWFQHEILKTGYTPPIILKPNPDPEIEIHTNQDHEIQIQTNPEKFTHSRSISDCQLSFQSGDFGLASPKLHTISSGKELFTDESEKKRDSVFREEKTEQQKRRVTRRKKKTLSKSLSDLEFMELKGFMDLGFVFSEEDKSSNLGSIIPGLKKLGNNNDEKHENGVSEKEISVSRPYLSEAWEAFDDEKEKIQQLMMMMNWNYPDLNDEICMKDNLKSWAHSIASTVR